MFYGGVDLGGARSRVHVRDAEGSPVFAGWAEDHEKVKSMLSKWGKDLCVAFQATDAAFSLHDLLAPVVGVVRVANPRDLRAIAHARIKNDRLDAEKLSELNRGDLIPEVWVPPRETRDQRELLLEQVRVRRSMSAEKVKIKALLRRWGSDGAFPIPDTIKGIAPALARALPEGALFVLEGKIERMKWLLKTERRLSREVRRRIPMGEPERWMASIPGVGSYTARWLVNVIGDVSRFPDARHVSSYFGLVPSERSSCNNIRRGGITKTGNRLVRWLFVQCAWAAIRSRKKDPAMPWRAMYENLVKRGRGKRRAITAVANHLARVAYALLRDRRPYESRTLVKKEGVAENKK